MPLENHFCPEKGRVVCGAKRNPTREPCATCGENVCHARPEVNGRCERHGGKSLMGPAVTHMKTGSRSRFLPTKLKESYERSLADPDLLSMRDEIALADARHEQLLRKLRRKETADAWVRAVRVRKHLHNAIAKNDLDGATKALEALDEAFNDAFYDFKVWNELRENAEHRQKLVDTERKRLEALQQYITTERAMGMIGSIVDIVKTCVVNVIDPVDERLGRKFLGAVVLAVRERLIESGPNEKPHEVPT